MKTKRNFSRIVVHASILVGTIRSRIHRFNYLQFLVKMMSQLGGNYFSLKLLYTGFKAEVKAINCFRFSKVDSIENFIYVYIQT